MACKDPGVETAYKTTKSILEKLKDYSWHAKAVLTLAALALDYGDFCRHLDQFHSSDQLTKSLGILKGIPALLTQPSIDHKHKGAIVELNKLIKDTLNVIDCIVTWRNDLLKKIEAYWKLIRFLKEPLDIAEVLKALIFASDNRQRVKVNEKKHIFFYGGKDSTWIKEFCKEATGLANDDVKGARISLFNVGKDSGIQRRFWKLIDNFFLYKSHMVTEVDTNEKGWVVLCKGARLVFSGYGTTVLTVLKNFDEWRQCLYDSVSDFEVCLEEHYNEQLFEDGFPCRVIDIPKSDGLIPDYRKCPDCSKIMETSFRFKCCNHNQHGFNLKFCHNHRGTKAQLRGSNIL
ncbi:protein sieve element occlusion b [Quercus suber]|uniref:Protein sieve element occlusion b n=1 Tax=Quercus suber TaxID=58331 RepID=A0AAW0KEI4_QUESU